MRSSFPGSRCPDLWGELELDNHHEWHYYPRLATTGYGDFSHFVHWFIRCGCAHGSLYCLWNGVSGIDTEKLYFTTRNTFCLYFSRDYTNRKRRTTRRLLEENNWYLNYRSIQLIVLHLNSCIGEVFMPVHMAMVTLGTAVLLYGLVIYGPTRGYLFLFILLTILILIGAYYVFLIGRGSSFSDEMQQALTSRKRISRSKYFLRLWQGCSPVRPAVGNFFPLKGQTVGTMVSTSIETSVDLMLI